MRLGSSILALVAGLAAFPLGSMASENLYRPLSEAEFKAWNTEYWQLSKCQNDLFEAHPDAAQAMIAKLVAKRLDDALVKEAKPLLQSDTAAMAALASSDLSRTERVQVVIVGLNMQAVRTDVLPSQGMRAFGLMRKYIALGIVPWCQPSAKFLSNVQKMLGEAFPPSTDTSKYRH